MKKFEGVKLKIQLTKDISLYSYFVNNYFVTKYGKSPDKAGIPFKVCSWLPTNLTAIIFKIKIVRYFNSLLWCKEKYCPTFSKWMRMQTGKEAKGYSLTQEKVVSKFKCMNAAMQHALS